MGIKNVRTYNRIIGINIKIKPLFINDFIPKIREIGTTIDASIKANVANKIRYPQSK